MMIKKITLIILMFIWFLPFLIMLLVAFSSQNTLSFSNLFNINNITFNNFTNAWQEANFSRYFLNTIIITVSSVIIILCITSLAGYIMGRFDFTGKRFIFSILLLSMGMPTIFFSIPVYQILRMLNCENSIIGLILAEIGGGHVIFILLFVSFFRSIPNEIEEAAVIDGANSYNIFFRVMFPLSKPIIGTVVITQSIWTWNSFLYPLILSINNPKIRTLSVGLYSFQGENIVDWGSISAGACITIIPIIILFIIFQDYFIQGISGAIKE